MEVHTKFIRRVPMLNKVKEALLLKQQWQAEQGITCRSSIDGYQT